MHARLDRGAVRLLTRNGLDWTHKYPAIAGAVASLHATKAYLDGELCGVGPDGITSFSMIQLASDSGNAAALVFFLFDLLHLDGEDLCAGPRCAGALPAAPCREGIAAPEHMPLRLGRLRRSAIAVGCQFRQQVRQAIGRFVAQPAHRLGNIQPGWL